MIPWIARNLVYFPIHAVRGEKVTKYIKHIQAFHRLPVPKMRELQWHKVKDLLNYVYHNNSYYKRFLDESRITIDLIKDRDDYRNIPIHNKEDIRSNAHRMISNDTFRLSKRRTSGCTGIPLAFVKDRDATAYMDAAMYEIYGWYDIAAGDRQARLWGMPLDWKNKTYWRIKDLILNRKRLSSFDITEKTCLKYYRSLKKFKPKFMYGYPSAICEFISILYQNDIDPSELGLRIVISTGEMLYEEQKHQIRQAFKCMVANEYGTTENGIIAFQCARGRMHLITHNLYIEFLNPDDGTPVQPGETGEIVITELHSYAMPFIRYRIGDLGTPTADLCDCGSRLPIVANIQGRVSDFVVTPDGRRMAGPIINYTMSAGIRRIKAIQRSIDSIEVMLEHVGPISEERLWEIKKKWLKLVGQNVHIDFKTVSRIPPDESGKLRAFVFDVDQSENNESVDD